MNCGSCVKPSRKFSVIFRFEIIVQNAITDLYLITAPNCFFYAWGLVTIYRNHSFGFSLVFQPPFLCLSTTSCLKRGCALSNKPYMDSRQKHSHQSLCAVHIHLQLHHHSCWTNSTYLCLHNGCWTRNHWERRGLVRKWEHTLVVGFKTPLSYATGGPSLPDFCRSYIKSKILRVKTISASVSTSSHCCYACQTFSACAAHLEFKVNRGRFTAHNKRPIFNQTPTQTAARREPKITKCCNVRDCQPSTILKCH